MPSAKAVPILREALAGLRLHVQNSPSVQAWRSLALAEEALLHYPAAHAALQRAISLSGTPDRKDLKRLVLLSEYAAKWEALGLSPEVIASLGNHLGSVLQAQPCDHSVRHTKAWLEARGVKSIAKVIRALASAGGYCDCEVLLNVV